jgi:hypothetical protein
MRRAKLIAILFLILLSGICGNAAGQVIHVEGEPIPGVPGYGVKVGLNPAGNIGALLVYQGTELSQQLRVCTEEPVERSGDVGTIATADLNFDGFGDLLLQVSSKNKNATFCIWLFEPKSKTYVPSSSLSRLVNPHADPKTKTVTTFRNTGCRRSCYEKQTFAWKHGHLQLIAEESVTENITTPTGYGGGCPFVRTVKQLRNGEMVESQRDMVNNLGSKCY